MVDPPRFCPQSDRSCSGSDWISDVPASPHYSPPSQTGKHEHSGSRLLATGPAKQQQRTEGDPSCAEWVLA
jgi:hypothetical protein